MPLPKPRIGVAPQGYATSPLTYPHFPWNEVWNLVTVFKGPDFILKRVFPTRCIWFQVTSFHIHKGLKGYSSHQTSCRSYVFGALSMQGCLRLAAIFNWMERSECTYLCNSTSHELFGEGNSWHIFLGGWTGHFLMCLKSPGVWGCPSTHCMLCAFRKFHNWFR